VNLGYLGNPLSFFLQLYPKRIFASKWHRFCRLLQFLSLNKELHSTEENTLNCLQSWSYLNRYKGRCHSCCSVCMSESVFQWFISLLYALRWHTHLLVWFRPYLHSSKKKLIQMDLENRPVQSERDAIPVMIVVYSCMSVSVSQVLHPSLCTHVKTHLVRFLLKWKTILLVISNDNRCNNIVNSSEAGDTSYSRQ